MATRYVRSTDGDNADDGSTWALAKASLVGVAAIDTAGDVIWVSQSHAESTASAITISLAGSRDSPVSLLCGNDGAEPPTALATTATVTTTGDSAITLSGYAYVYGITFNCGTGANSPAITLNTSGTYENCNFCIVSTGSTGLVRAQSTSVLSVWKNCGFRFGAAGQSVTMQAGQRVIIGGSLLSGGASPTAFFRLSQYGSLLVSAFDFSNASSDMHMVYGQNSASLIVLRDCKLPASWSGSLLTNGGAGNRVEMYNCDSADTNYTVRVQDYYGELTQETTLVRTGGASDGATAISWKIVTTANSKWGYEFITPEIHAWNDSTGSSTTVTVEILHDSATNLTDAEVWLEVMSLNTSGYSLGTWTSDSKADYLASAADQADSSETWTTTGMSNPNTQKLSVSFTPQEKGVIVARVCVAKASKTLYVDPVLTVS